ncbi:sensor histidine kinase [Thiohalobacter sp. IOR34]|uniref:sensor histidine kinase n=1 Tax=Thiohalobacter sp. IOR34 TaxID=3057176 RepID=UPI0025AF0B5A|nr:sensor histidine kinase [Thiohalobacter sp. IOR34]WJW74307.1 sensor histidine kinase [Thiohalobacter sp. IOR34]
MSSRAERPVSLERTLSWLLGLLLLLVLVVLLGIAAWIGRESAIQFALTRLQHDAEAIIGGLDMSQHRIVRALPPIYQQPLSGHYYLVRFDDGVERLSRSLWNDPRIISVQELPAGSHRLAPGPRNQQLLIWQNAYEKDGRRFTLVIAEDVAPLLSAIRRFLWIGLGASLAAVLLMLLLQRLVIRRAFARLDAAREEVRAVRSGRLDRLHTDVPAEVLPLVEELNQLLEAWKQQQARSHNALGNLAHALKAPLQLILRYGEANQDARIVEQARRMQQLIEQELKRARISGKATGGQHFQPQQDIGDLVDTIRTLYHHKALEIESRIEAPASLPLAQNDMLELLGNLLDNAAKWAERKIRIGLYSNGSLSLTVEDDGPGIDPALHEELLARGSRLDENRPGHGLGLAIVRDIVELYGGSLALDRSPGLNGLRVRVTLPLG